MRDTIRNQLDDLVRWRHDFHQHPELAFEEVRTSQLVADRLESFGIEVHRGLAKTGVVGILKKGDSDRHLGLRADMDALPIHEVNDFGHASSADGKMHACGHDGHTTMLLGAARALSQSESFDGTVHFIFQPAEEKDGGGRVMVEEGLFEKFPCDRVFGMHNMPGVGVGGFALCPGPMLAAIDVVDMRLRSEGGHAAMPHLAVDTVVLGAQLILATQTIVSRNVDPLDNAVITLTRLEGGDADNVIPDTVTIGGCVRTFRESTQNLIERRLSELGEGIANSNGASFELDYQRYYPATVNTEAEVGMAAKAAGSIGTSVNPEMTPIMGSEDFSFMLRERPGAFIMMGNGSSSGLHTPTYDFNDEALGVGVSYWVELVEQLMPAAG